MTKYQRSGVIVIIAVLLIKVINTIPEGAFSAAARLIVVLLAATAVAWVYLKDKFPRK